MNGRAVALKKRQQQQQQRDQQEAQAPPATPGRTQPIGGD